MPNPFSRRDMLRLSAAAVAAAAMPGITWAAEKKKIPIALELYSVRKEMAKDFTGTIEAVGKMGYQGVEFAGYFGWDSKPTELRKLLDDNGLKCCGTHTAFITLQGDYLNKTIELHKTLGNKFLICPSLQADSARRWESLAGQFNEIAERAKKQGMFIGYHSHAPDFKKFDDGRTPWEILFDNTNADVVQQIDTGNTLEGGGDPLALIKKYPGRTKTTHIKEFGGPAGCAIGEGTVDFKSLFEAYESVGGVEWYIVEHETGKVPLESVKACLEGMHKFGR
jgi:sugar phosphate isomerase/epimerase